MGGLFGGGKQTSTTEQRIAGMKYQSSAFGTPIPLVYGRGRISNNLVWYGAFTAIPHTSPQATGGKGGGGGGSTTTTYTYTAAVILGMCEGPIGGVLSAWNSKSRGSLAVSVGASAIAYAGSASQTAWSYLSTNFPGQDLSYRRLAYVCAPNLDLGGNSQMPNISFEVSGLTGAGPFASVGFDENPANVLNDFFSDTSHGAGIPAASIGDLTNYANYCIAFGLGISPVLDSAKPAADWVKQWLAATNTACVYSGGVLKFIPYGDAAAGAFIPNTTIIYDLDDDAFISDGTSDPVRVTRSPQRDAFNHIQVKFSNRANQYNSEIVEAKDQANIEAFGLRTSSPYDFPEICTAATARHVAQLIMQRGLYIRNTYEFRLPWKYILLEPMDCVTLTDPAIGLDRAPVRIVSIDEDADGLLSVVAEELPIGAASSALYPSQGGSGFAHNYNDAAGAPNDMVAFEAPVSMAATGLEVWIATSGGAIWGGCEVWVSRDNATYQKAGTINGGARHGYLTAPLPSAPDPDATSTLSVDISACGGLLSGGTKADADALNTLCYVDGEFISYQTATLTGAGLYDLGTYLRRGQLGSTISSHLPGSRFARVDQALFKYPFAPDMAGTPLYIKLRSFNVYGEALDALDSISPSTYNITGKALLSPLPDVTGLIYSYQSGKAVIKWDAVVDSFRVGIDYEVRQGATWGTAITLGVVRQREIVIGSSDTYWVGAIYTAPNGMVARSANPQNIGIGVATIPANVVASYDEAASGWSGTVSGGAYYDPTVGLVELAGTGTIAGVPVFSALTTVEYYGGISPLGYYEIPVGHNIDIGAPQPCSVSVTTSAASDSPFAALFSSIPSVAAEASIAGDYSAFSSVTPEINTSQDGVTWDGWRTFVPNTYIARVFKARAKLTSISTAVSAYLTSFKFAVDMPDKVQTGTGVPIAAAGTAITFQAAYQVAPNVQITILNQVAGDIIEFPVAPTTTGFTVKITNGGAGVVRSVNWLSSGY